jgi:hypothetical protein
MADLAGATENDTDLHGDPDARHWAERFVARVGQYPGVPADEGAMLAWFAGAIETGRMVGRREGEEVPVARVVRQLLGDLGHMYGPVFVARLAAELAEPTPIADAATAAVAAVDAGADVAEP